MAGQVSKVQQVVQQAKTLFLNSSITHSVHDPGFAADLEILKKLVSALSPEDFNVSPALVSRQWDYEPYVVDSPAACMDVYECSGFSIGIFLLKPYKSMPLHDHPGMHGIMKLLFGSMVVTSYSSYEKRFKPSSEFLAKISSKVQLTPLSDPCVLYPENGNIHEIQAESEPVAFLDILAPPYSPSGGRDCNYYFKQSRQTASEELVYLQQGPNPSWFSCIPLAHELGVKVE